MVVSQRCLVLDGCRNGDAASLEAGRDDDVEHEDAEVVGEVGPGPGARGFCVVEHGGCEGEVERFGEV